MAFDPQNKLEQSLIQAARDPAHRPQFYRDFIESDIVVMQHGPHFAETKETTLESGLDPFGILEGLYADFDYPDEIHHLIPFNVPSDGYRPQDHTHEENVARLMSMWGEYVGQHMSLRPERNG